MSVWAYNFTTNKITRKDDIIILSYMYLTLPAKSHHQISDK